MRAPLLAIAISLIAATALPALADDPCLTGSELHDVARMGAVMGFGGGLRRCGNCLGANYQPTVDKYEATGMLVEFRQSEAVLENAQSKFEYTDGLVRDVARKYANEVSADCKACEAAAGSVSQLSSREVREKVYGDIADKVVKLSSYRQCR